MVLLSEDLRPASCTASERWLASAPPGHGRRGARSCWPLGALTDPRGSCARSPGTSLFPQWLQNTLGQVLGALEHLHQLDLIHR